MDFLDYVELLARPYDDFSHTSFTYSRRSYYYCYSLKPLLAY